MTLRDPASPEGHLDPSIPRVWLIDLTHPAADALADSGLNSDAERFRADEFGDPALGRRLLVRRSVLRLLLARELGQPPDRIEIVTAPGGKPVLLPSGDSPSLAFSASHSQHLFGLAVAPVSSLGLDVEQVREVRRARAISERWFGREDAAALDGLGEEELVQEFMRVWTAKEALAKRHGAGLRLMSGASTELALDEPIAAGCLRYFQPADGFTGAVASSEVVLGLDVVRPEPEEWLT